MTTDAITVVGLRMLCRAAEAGSFQAAAEDLGYSQSAVSRQVSALEGSLGEQLFVRGRRGVVPTAAGEVLLAAGTRVLAELDGAQHRIDGLHEQLGGRVMAGAFPAAAATLLPRAIADVQARYPTLRVSVDESASPTLVRRVRSGRVDAAVIAVGTGPAEPDLTDLQRHELPAVGLHVAVPAGHRLARRTRVRPADLSREPWITGADSPGEPRFGAWPSLNNPTVAFTVRHWPARLGLVAAGLGITVIPGVAVASVPAGVAVLAVDDPAHPSRTGLVVTRRDPTPQAAELVRALQTTAQVMAEQAAGSADRQL